MMQDLSKKSGTWKWGLLCLAFLAPFFFLSYGAANQYASGLADVSVIVFDWEIWIPLWPWTIVPYWSIDLFYGLSLLLCWNKFELKQHVLRLFLAQVLCIALFIAFPLKFSFDRPELSGFFGLWFEVLMGFDKPFNQAPSLHIVLLVTLWDFYRRHVQGYWKYIVDFWAFLIGISVLTTWQHHFIDVPTGLLVGGLCLWLFPMDMQSPFRKDPLQRLTPKHLKFGSYYLIASVVLVIISYVFKGISLWLLYPAISLFLVSLAYFFVRAHFFQKNTKGQLSTGTVLLFAPYLVFAWLNSRIWTRQHPHDSLMIEIKDTQIFLGRIPNSHHARTYQALFDCCAELPRDQPHLAAQYLSLDLIPLQANQLKYATDALDQLFKQIVAPSAESKKMLIFCALGYSRSSAILCAWLVKNHYAENILDAIMLIQKSRPWIVLNQAQLEQLNVYAFQLKGLAP